jgi:transcriptional regulator with XRE-family HTH domain
MTEQVLKSLYINIGLKIKEARLNRGLNQEAFAQMLKLTRASVVNIEKGRQRVSIHLLYEICKITDVDILEILPILQKGNELSPKWKKKIENSAEGDIIREPKLSNFLIEITSKEQL